MSCKHVVPLLCPPNIFPVHSCQLVSYNTFICNFLCSSQISLSTAFIHLTIFNSTLVISPLLLSSPVCVCVCVCVCVFLYGFVKVCVCLCVCVCVLVFLYIYMCVWLYMRRCVCIQ